MFFFKKLISPLFMPLAAAVLLLISGLCLIWFSRRQNAGRILATTGLGVLLLSGFSPFADSILSPLEQTFPSYIKSDREIKYVAVLGGGHSSDRKISNVSSLNSASLARLAEGIRIYRENPGSRLILSGWGGKDPVTNAHLMADVAESLGVPAENIITEPRPRDTGEEALMIKEIVGREAFVLVTSAAHIKRAMYLFRQQDLEPVPAPTYFMVRESEKTNLLPEARAIGKTEMAAHEYLGLLWAYITGNQY